MKKRLLSLLLIACLCLALLPGAASAAGPEYAETVTVNTAAELAAALPSGEHETIPVAELGANITVDKANSVHAMGRLIVPKDKTLTIAEGARVQANVVNYGTILVQSGGALETTQGGDIENHGSLTVASGATLTSQMGGRVVNDGTLKLDGTFRCGSVNYDKTDHLWFQNSGTVSGRGDLVVYDAGAGDAERDSVKLDAMIEGAMGALGQTRRYGDGYWDDVNIFKEVEVSDYAELKAAFPKGGRKVAGEDVEGNMDVIAVLREDVTVTDGDVQTMGKLIVPEGETLTVAEGGDLEIGIENNGTVAVRSGGTLKTTMGGDIVNHGSLTVASGATLTSQKGSSVVNAGAMTLDGTFRCGVAYIIENDTAAVQIWFKNEDGGTVTGSGAAVPHAVGVVPDEVLAAATELLRTAVQPPLQPIDPGYVVSGGGASVYAVTAETPEHGKLTASAASASEGTAVTVTPVPDDGYELDKITVTGADGGAIPVTERGDGSWGFTMPKRAVTVTAVFRKTDHSALCPSGGFQDVAPDAWYHEAVDFVLENGLMRGTSDSTFEPDGTTTRGMIVTILYRLEGAPMIRSGMPFSDVTESDWYGMAVSWAESKGIVNGYEDGSFRPNEPITREQLAAILYRHAQSKGQGFTGLWSFRLDFPDAGDVSDWANEAMSWMVMNGVVGGRDGRLVPKGSASRAETAAMLMRFLTL